MKTETVHFPAIAEPVLFYIGQSQDENHSLLDLAKPEDFWFHLGSISSAHVIGVVPKGIPRKQLSYIVKRGALLCKQHTAKVASKSHVAVIYTRVRHVTKTETPGEVITENTQLIIC
jgi:predicted ribosome quality control (RQC) complex YloA/Tae2 family protein